MGLPITGTCYPIGQQYTAGQTLPCNGPTSSTTNMEHVLCCTVSQVLNRELSPRAERVRVALRGKCRVRVSVKSRTVGGWCEMAASWSNEFVVGQSPADKDVNTEAEEATALEAVTRRQTVKI
jgi:hypothetical protein